VVVPAPKTHIYRAISLTQGLFCVSAEKTVMAQIIASMTLRIVGGVVRMSTSPGKPPGNHSEGK
jgi:hypothetical protein